ncbi:ribokinase [Antribacter sp. KLBMP9083]|uniref:Ribokinase n=1 Tax=Antribacter soli TaxID=2910976 RepID=A0AA41U8Y9_9MICO|nr:ribokinase [Antribacter soli]MCF4120992.1 ribokinase [Antribacter soli]
MSTSGERAPGKGRVVVVGSANVDLVVDVPRHPRGGETVLGGELRRTPGGKGANQAAGAARAGGADTVLVAALGRDDGAELLLRSLGEAGVHTTGVRRVGAPTGTALITVSPDGENAIVVAPGANDHLSVDDGARELIATADVVLAQLEIPLETVVAAAEARRPGATFVLNAAPSRELPESLWRAVDVLVVNEHEAADLAGRQGGAPPDEPADLARALLSRVPEVVVTLGGDGALVAGRGRRDVRVPGIAVDVVDTTAAGDTFCGVLAAEIAHGADLADAARTAGVAGALAVTRAGAQEAVPDREEVLAAIRREEER